MEFWGPTTISGNACLEREKGFEPSTSRLEGSTSESEVVRDSALEHVDLGEVSNKKKVSIAYLQLTSNSA
jgi:hypothetical protein